MSLNSLINKSPKGLMDCRVKVSQLNSIEQQALLAQGSSPKITCQRMAGLDKRKKLDSIQMLNYQFLSKSVISVRDAELKRNSFVSPPFRAISMP